jgi:hypothetical protein
MALPSQWAMSWIDVERCIVAACNHAQPFALNTENRLPLPVSDRLKEKHRTGDWRGDQAEAEPTSRGST